MKRSMPIRSKVSSLPEDSKKLVCTSETQPWSSWKFRVRCWKLKVASCKLQAASYKLQVSRLIDWKIGKLWEIYLSRFTYLAKNMISHHLASIWTKRKYIQGVPKEADRIEKLQSRCSIYFLNLSNDTKPDHPPPAFGSGAGATLKS